MTREEIKKLANMARIELRDDEEIILTERIQGILEYVAQISAITASEKQKKVGTLYNVMREDEITNAPGTHRDAILANAPQRDGNYLSVKKILTQ